ncbi:MAG TPA: hypothetical protein VEK07_05250 [Polyangiaceae bacterium]|nr:hypothetical protein [Polyangiaceae bacterium]
MASMPGPPFQRPAHLQDYLDAIRYSFADRATLEYLWWPSPFDH